MLLNWFALLPFLINLPPCHSMSKEKANNNASIFPSSMEVPLGTNYRGELLGSDQVPDIPRKVEKHLVQQRLESRITLGVMGFIALAMAAIAFKPVPTLEVRPDGTTAKLRPMEAGSDTELKLVRDIVGKRLPILYTWFGSRPDPEDPSHRSMIENKRMPIAWSVDGKNEDCGEIPATAWEERHILTNEIMMSTLCSIAKQIESSNGVIWTNTNSPLATGYRLILKEGSPSFPEELGQGKWKVVLNGVIERWSPSAVNLATLSNTTLQYVDWEVYVRRTSPQHSLIPNERGIDELAWGTKDGLEVYAINPYDPRKETDPEVK
jgi:hypothetical protein